MSHVYAAVRAVSDALLAQQCSTRLACSLLAAAVRAATQVTKAVPTNDEDLRISDLVDARLGMLKPVPHEQIVAGLVSGHSVHFPTRLVNDADRLKANAARRAGFERESPLSEATTKELKSLQRGRKRKTSKT